MAERSIAAVLKTVEGYTSGGSNPSLSAWLKCKESKKKSEILNPCSPVAKRIVVMGLKSANNRK